MALADDIERLEQLRTAGTLSDEEFHAAKARVLRESAAPAIDGMICGMTPKTWCLLMHVSQLLNVAPGAGMVAPIVMWAISKDQSIDADRHGRVIINWLISSFIYAAVSAALVFVIIGIPLLFIIAVLAIIFPIVGALKANDGILWLYPLSIRFLDPDAA